MDRSLIQRNANRDDLWVVPCVGHVQDISTVVDTIIFINIAITECNVLAPSLLTGVTTLIALSTNLTCILQGGTST